VANRWKGEIGFEAEGKRYTLMYSINALCMLESEFSDVSADIGALIGGKSGKRMTTLRTVFWAGLSDYHPELSKKEVGDIMTSLGFMPSLNKVTEAIVLAFPEMAAGVDPLAGQPAVDGAGPSS
jgi:hypothetical protein